MNLRLVLFPECDRTCKGCCNKDWDLEALPECKSYAGYDKILLTGGEPMLRPCLVRDVIFDIRAQSKAKIIMYTAFRDNYRDLAHMLDVYLDGITLTLHTRKDVEPFKWLNQELKEVHLEDKSLRLNVFHGISLGGEDVSKWKVKRGIRWIKDCPLPENEVLMRLPRSML